jgi:hypothetical protein
MLRKFSMFSWNFVASEFYVIGAVLVGLAVFEAAPKILNLYKNSKSEVKK